MLEIMETVVLYYDDPNTEYKASSFIPLLWRGGVAFTDKIGAVIVFKTVWPRSSNQQHAAPESAEDNWSTSE